MSGNVSPIRRSARVQRRVVSEPKEQEPTLGAKVPTHVFGIVEQLVSAKASPWASRSEFCREAFDDLVIKIREYDKEGYPPELALRIKAYQDRRAVERELEFIDGIKKMIEDIAQLDMSVAITPFLFQCKRKAQGYPEPYRGWIIRSVDSVLARPSLT